MAFELYKGRVIIQGSDREINKDLENSLIVTLRMGIFGFKGIPTHLNTTSAMFGKVGFTSTVIARGF